MRAYLLKRLFLLIFTLWGITLVSFLMVNLAPGSPLEMKLARDPSGGLSSEKASISQENLEALKKLYNLDKPLLVRYGIWVKDIFTFNFGTSFVDHRQVSEKILERLPISLILGITSVIIALFLGIPLGIASGTFHNTLFDRVVAFLVIAFFSLPSYVLGIYLLTFFGGGEFFDLFPVYGLQSEDYDVLPWVGKFFDRAHHLFLPCLCYSIGGLAMITQQQRNSLLEVLRQDYIRTARSKGLGEIAVVLKHAFRNSLIPIITMTGGMIPALLGGGVIVETLFSIPGLGLLAYEALLQRDYPTIMADFTIFAFLSLIGILVADICYVLADPRIDFEGR